MRVWLDDERPAPEGWTACRWPADAIALLETGQVTHLSLDHDLGEDSSYANPRTGMDVVRWLEEAVVVRGFKLPRCAVHSMNPVAGPLMRQILHALWRRTEVT